MEGFVSLFLFILFPVIGIGLIATSLSKKYSSRKSRFIFGVLSLCIPALYLLSSFKHHNKTKGLIYGEYSLKGERQIKLILKADSTYLMDSLPELSQYDKGRWRTTEWDYYELKLDGMNRQLSFRISSEGDRVVLRYHPWKKEDPKPEQELVFIKEEK
ncbi:hypothetical protein I2I11_13720 [Pontibacter sp. 172403-2]|uniref:hypothetical protein n=1 Tax=Pontibacter rufus TaxID=2791028 RepID=UPI0018AF83C5|nr:hypothetical protein [Pontibacter sp. 172403-2]MBF9254359.1 hypothetical protein [Pontibacter sp. 172403-2]